MKKQLTGLLALLTLTLVLFSSCASTSEQAATSLADGDYTTAIEKSLEALKEEPGLAEATVVLNEAWSRANSEWNAQIASYESSSDGNEVFKAINFYNALTTIHKMVEDAGRDELKADSDKIYKKAMVTQNRVADIYFKNGNELLASGGRANARDAVLFYRGTKRLNSDYPNIDKTLEEAIKQATVKVVIQMAEGSSSVEILPLLEKKFAALDLVEIVGTTDKDINDFAKSKDADIMVYLELKTTTKTELLDVYRPINSWVTQAPNWKVEKRSLLASGECVVAVKVIDVKTNTTLNEGTLNVQDSTDFGFSFSVLAPDKHDTMKVQIRDMPKPETLNFAILASGADITALGSQLSVFEKIEFNGKFGFENGMQGIDDWGGLDFSMKRTPADLKAYNKHVFLLFDGIAAPVYDQYMYGFTYGYGNSKTENVFARVETARIEKANYWKLLEWLDSTKTKKNSVNLFLESNFNPKILNEITKTVSPFIK